jgi:hypothetical protein
MKRKKPRHFRWWLIVLLVIAAAVVTGILLGSEEGNKGKEFRSTSESPDMEDRIGAVAPEGPTPAKQNQRLSPDGGKSSPQAHRLSTDGPMTPPEGHSLPTELKILSPNGQISSSEGYKLSREGRIITPEGHSLSPGWKIVSPDGQIHSPEAFRPSTEGQIYSSEAYKLPTGGQIQSPEAYKLPTGGQIQSPEAFRPSTEGQIISQEEQRLSSVESSESPLLAPPKREEDDCLPIQQEMEDFFTYLNGRNYVQRLKPGIDTRAWFRDLVQTLSTTPPLPSGERLDFQLMARNIFHFYRILDKNDILLVLEILKNEREALEMNLDLFFEWCFRKTHCPDPERIRPNEMVLYRYAGFFLNTIGGRSYLSRRSSDLRLLITYYAALIIHEMDRRGSNTYGIDPVPYIAPLAGEITMKSDLYFQNEYLQQLTRLSDYYTSRR